ncbi:TPA: zinc-ribbon domain-containing protein, partial [Streptococcus suis]
MFCIECGNKVETGFKFCPNCGTKVSQKEAMKTQSSEKIQKRAETQGREYMLQAYRGNFYDSERMYPISEYREMFFYVSMINSNFYIVVYSPKKGTKHLFVKLQNQDLFSDNFAENQVYVNSFGIFIKCGKGNQFIHVDFDRKIQRVLPL